jgi:hypothetical protein
MPRENMQEIYFGTERLRINNLYSLFWFNKSLFIQNFCSSKDSIFFISIKYLIGIIPGF